jgi:hypothetical protein
MSNSAPVLNGMADVLRTHGIVKAVVIDDAFDLDIVDCISSQELSTFKVDIDRDAEIKKELIENGLNIASLLKKDAVSLETLLQKRSSLDKARQSVEMLLRDYLERREMVDDLVSHLRKLGLDVVPLGADQAIPENLNAQIAFVDFYLDDQVLTNVDFPANESDPSEKSRKKARDIYERTRAFIFLMSSRDEVSQEEAGFRKKAKLLRGYFQFQKKTTLSDEQALYECLGAIPLKAEFRHTLHDFIDCLDERSKAVSTLFMEQVRDLGLEDYAQLRQLSLNKDGHPFGDYILRMFGHYMTSLVLEDADVGASVTKLDDTEFQSLLPIRAEPTPTLGTFYLASLTEKLRNPITFTAGAEVPGTPAVQTSHTTSTATEDSVHVQPTEGAARASDVVAAVPPVITPLVLPVKAETGPSLVRLELGDLFVKNASSPIYAVMNPACDLALGVGRDREPDDAVLLIPGSLRHLYESYQGERAPTMFTSIYEMGGVLYRIDWDYRRFRSIQHKAIAEDLLTKGYRCERRLHLGPALELQQHFASSISRVGLPVPPPIRHSHDVLIYCRGVEGEWENIGEVIKAAIITLHTRAKDQFIITTNAAKPIREAIRAHVAKLRETDSSVEWKCEKLKRSQYAGQLNVSLERWSQDLPFMRTLGNLPGGREKEKRWNEKKIELKARLGLMREATFDTQEVVDADAILVVDLMPMLLGQVATQNEVPLEMEEA